MFDPKEIVIISRVPCSRVSTVCTTACMRTGGICLRHLQMRLRRESSNVPGLTTGQLF